MSAEPTFAISPEWTEAVAKRAADLVVEGLTDVIGDQVVDASARRRRLALTKAEAAEAIGVSVDHLERHVLPKLRIVRSGRLRLIPVEELDRWIERHAARALEGR